MNFMIINVIYDNLKNILIVHDSVPSIKIINFQNNQQIEII
jgi:hypothetical protein